MLRMYLYKGNVYTLTPARTSNVEKLHVLADEADLNRTAWWAALMTLVSIGLSIVLIFKTF
jgi:hypothetical protein